MPMLTTKQRPTVVEVYDVAADEKKRISLRNARTKFFHVKALSNGCFLLEPRILVPLESSSGRALKMAAETAAPSRPAKINIGDEGKAKFIMRHLLAEGQERMTKSAIAELVMERYPGTKASTAKHTVDWYASTGLKRKGLVSNHLPEGRASNVAFPSVAISARTLKMLDHSMANLKKGLASAPIDLSIFTED